MSDNVECPNCGQEIDFKNVIFINKNQAKVITVAYMFECMKCEGVFCPGPREFEPLSDEQREEIKKTMDEVEDA